MVIDYYQLFKIITLTIMPTTVKIKWLHFLSLSLSLSFFSRATSNKCTLT